MQCGHTGASHFSPKIFFWSLFYTPRITRLYLRCGANQPFLLGRTIRATSHIDENIGPIALTFKAADLVPAHADLADTRR